MGKRLLILGAGPGGLEAAHTLRKGLASEHSITLEDRESRFTMGILKGGLLTPGTGLNLQLLSCPRPHSGANPPSHPGKSPCIDANQHKSASYHKDECHLFGG